MCYIVTLRMCFGIKLELSNLCVYLKFTCVKKLSMSKFTKFCEAGVPIIFY